MHIQGEVNTSLLLDVVQGLTPESKYAQTGGGKYFTVIRCCSRCSTVFAYSAIIMG